MYKKEHYIKYKNSHRCRLILKYIKRRCDNKKCKSYKNYGGRGIECRITEEESKDLWIRDKADVMEKPSIDRINNDGNYEFGNCRFIEHRINSGRSAKEHAHKILQYDLEGNFIKQWENANAVSNYLNIHPMSVNRICRTETTRTGYVWKYNKPIRKSKEIEK